MKNSQLTPHRPKHKPTQNRQSSETGLYLPGWRTVKMKKDEAENSCFVLPSREDKITSGLPASGDPKSGGDHIRQAKPFGPFCFYRYALPEQARSRFAQKQKPPRCRGFANLCVGKTGFEIFRNMLIFNKLQRQKQNAH